jgi:hypothetical protein
VPNKRHPAKTYISFWGTLLLKKQLQKIALLKGLTLSSLAVKILRDFLKREQHALSAKDET